MPSISWRRSEGLTTSTATRTTGLTENFSTCGTIQIVSTVLTKTYFDQIEHDKQQNHQSRVAAQLDSFGDKIIIRSMNLLQLFSFCWESNFLFCFANSQETHTVAAAAKQQQQQQQTTTENNNNKSRKQHSSSNQQQKTTITENDTTAINNSNQQQQQQQHQPTANKNKNNSSSGNSQQCTSS